MPSLEQYVQLQRVMFFLQHKRHYIIISSDHLFTFYALGRTGIKPKPLVELVMSRFLKYIYNYIWKTFEGKKCGFLAICKRGKFYQSV